MGCNTMKPLQGIVVVDFSQFLAGPLASLRLADMGATVIKVERPPTGDICRTLYVSKQKIGGDSTIFHAINRNKHSVAVDLKCPHDKQKILNLIRDADVVIQNFRPGIAQKLGIDYCSLQQINPQLVYGSVSGYGIQKSQWYKKPGQDLLVQSLSGITWHNIKNTNSPIPMGLSVADMCAGYDLTQGILALLIRRATTCTGGLIEISLLESLLHMQITEFCPMLNNCPTTYTHDIQAVFATKDSYVAIVAHISQIQNIIPNVTKTGDIAHAVSQQNTQYWLNICAGYDNIYIAPVLSWHDIRNSEYYKHIQFEQTVYSPTYPPTHTTRCPFCIDGDIITSYLGAPDVGEHTHMYIK